MKVLRYVFPRPTNTSEVVVWLPDDPDFELDDEQRQLCENAVYGSGNNFQAARKIRQYLAPIQLVDFRGETPPGERWLVEQSILKHTPCPLPRVFSIPRAQKETRMERKETHDFFMPLPGDYEPSVGHVGRGGSAGSVVTFDYGPHVVTIHGNLQEEWEKLSLEDLALAVESLNLGARYREGVTLPELLFDLGAHLGRMGHWPAIHQIGTADELRRRTTVDELLSDLG